MVPARMAAQEVRANWFLMALAAQEPLQEAAVAAHLDITQLRVTSLTAAGAVAVATPKPLFHHLRSEQF